MTQQALIGSLSKRLSDWAAENDMTVRWPNDKAFTPPTDGSGWIRATFFGLESQQAAVGSTGLNLLEGIMHLSVFYPRGTYAGAAYSKAEALISHFKRGTVTDAVSGVVARVSQAWREADLEEEKWFHVPVKVRYFQHVSN